MQVAYVYILVLKARVSMYAYGYLSSQCVQRVSSAPVKVVPVAMQHWLCHEGSPGSRIDKCDTHDERSIDKLTYSSFERR